MQCNTCRQKSCLKWCSHCARHRTMSSGVTVIEHIDLTALFTYRTMSYVATTLTQKLNLLQFVRQLSYDVVRDRATPAQHSNLHVKVAGRHRTTPNDVVRCRCIVRCRLTSCVKASSGGVRCRAQCEHRLKLSLTNN